MMDFKTYKLWQEGKIELRCKECNEVIKSHVKTIAELSPLKR